MTDAPVRNVFFLRTGTAIMASWDKHLRTWDAGSGKLISDRTAGAESLSTGCEPVH